MCAVDALTLEVNSGEIFGFLGPNGAGKTTTINMLTGLLRPTSGTATLGGYDIQKQSLQAKAILGLMPDTPQLYEALSGRQFVRMIADLYEVPTGQAENEMGVLLEQLELTDAADDQIKGIFLRHAEENLTHLDSCASPTKFFSLMNRPVAWIPGAHALSGKSCANAVNAGLLYS